MEAAPSVHYGDVRPYAEDAAGQVATEPHGGSAAATVAVEAGVATAALVAAQWPSVADRVQALLALRLQFQCSSAAEVCVPLEALAMWRHLRVWLSHRH